MQLKYLLKGTQIWQLSLQDILSTPVIHSGSILHYTDYTNFIKVSIMITDGSKCFWGPIIDAMDIRPEAHQEIWNVSCMTCYHVPFFQHGSVWKWTTIWRQNDFFLQRCASNKFPSLSAALTVQQWRRRDIPAFHLLMTSWFQVTCPWQIQLKHPIPVPVWRWYSFYLHDLLVEAYRCQLKQYFKQPWTVMRQLFGDVRWYSYSVCPHPKPVGFCFENKAKLQVSAKPWNKNSSGQTAIIIHRPKIADIFKRRLFVFQRQKPIKTTEGILKPLNKRGLLS